ncbi:MAG: hypothetical protein IKO42_00415 [Opitutales bacterium]|nr:hypothetical protein [Opitutales bacterium]
MKRAKGLFSYIFILIAALVLSGCGKDYNKYIANRWGVELPFCVSKNEIIKQSSNWGYIIVKTTDANIESLMKMDMPKYSYSEWGAADSNMFIDDVFIDKSLIRSLYKDPGKCCIKGIFIDKAKKTAIFLDYNWAGY